MEGVLGKSGSSYSKPRDTGILFAIPRKKDRSDIGINASFSFIGIDIWNAYEFSFIDETHLIRSGILQLRISSNSTNLVESKSLKLYLNSFCEYRSSLESLLDDIREDLNSLLDSGDVRLVFQQFNNVRSFEKPYEDLFSNTWHVLDNVVPGVSFLKLKVNADSIGTSQQKATYFTNLLKSNCKVTGQPDWGSATIFLSGAQIPDKQDMLAYLLSFKDEFHFHEEVAERIVFDLVTIYDADEVVVILNYTRRGGIDINPIRIYSKHDLAQWSEWLAAFEWKRHIRQ